MDTASTQQDFGAVKQRLEYIADAVGNEDMPLEEALDLFEEAVSLGMKVGDLLEVGLDDAEEAGYIDPATRTTMYSYVSFTGRHIVTSRPQAADR